MAFKAICAVNLYELTPRARRDIFVIWIRIAQDSVEAADRVETAILENCETLALLPRLGNARPKLTHKPVLTWPTHPYENYLLVYNPETKPIRILRVIQASRRKVWGRGI